MKSKAMSIFMKETLANVTNYNIFMQVFTGSKD